MNTLIDLIAGKIEKITDFDKKLAADYIVYYGIEESEIKEYADSFLEECYRYNSDSGFYESVDADELPMSEKIFEKGKSTYIYGGQKIVKYN